MTLNEHIKDVEQLIEGRFRQHEQAEVITSLPGIGVILGAEFLAATGGDMDAFASPDRLAGFAGLAPAARDSGRIHGNLHRPQRYHRGLQRVFYTSALISIQRHPESRAFYDRGRREGKRHTQAVLALARRRVNVPPARQPHLPGHPARTQGGLNSLAQLTTSLGVLRRQRRSATVHRSSARVASCLSRAFRHGPFQGVRAHNPQAACRFVLLVIGLASSRATRSHFMHQQGY